MGSPFHHPTPLRCHHRRLESWGMIGLPLRSVSIGPAKMAKHGLGDIQRAFNAFDANGDGMISREEFVGMLTLDTSKGASPFTKEQAEALFARFDVDNSGTVDADEFAAAWSSDGTQLGAAVASFDSRATTYTAIHALLKSVESGAPQNKITKWELSSQGINTEIANSLAAYMAVSHSLTQVLAF